MITEPEIGKEYILEAVDGNLKANVKSVKVKKKKTTIKQVSDKKKKRLKET